jgi:glyoxylase-like metal-dependent hydrolase (beta-lactamase superfamily II)
MENLIRLTVKSTHFYLVDCLGGKLLVDAGWELPAFTAQLKQYRVPVSAIRYVMFTHHHPDHAGLVQDIRNLSGAKLIIHEKQIPYLENLRAFYAKKGGYTPIRVEKTDLISPSRSALRAIGIQGQIVETPGHSDDSISLALDNHSAFIGDLTSPDFVEPENESTIRKSWRKLLDLGVETFYHSHTDPIPAERIRRSLASQG